MNANTISEQEFQEGLKRYPYERWTVKKQDYYQATGITPFESAEDYDEEF
jgi:hypothetical protein